MLTALSADAVHWLSDFGLELGNLSQCGGHSVSRTHRITPDASGRALPVGWGIVSTLGRATQAFDPARFTAMTGARAVRLVTGTRHVRACQKCGRGAARLCVAPCSPPVRARPCAARRSDEGGVESIALDGVTGVEVEVAGEDGATKRVVLEVRDAAAAAAAAGGHLCDRAREHARVRALHRAECRALTTTRCSPCPGRRRARSG